MVLLGSNQKAFLLHHTVALISTYLVLDHLQGQGNKQDGAFFSFSGPENLATSFSPSLQAHHDMPEDAVLPRVLLLVRASK